MEPNISFIPHFLKRRDDGLTASALTTNELRDPERIAHYLFCLHIFYFAHLSQHLNLSATAFPLVEHNSSASRLVSCKCLKHPTLRLARYITFPLNLVGPSILSNAIGTGLQRPPAFRPKNSVFQRNRDR